MGEWKARVGTDGWTELRDWLRSHRRHPHQLRHNAGTNIRREFGIEAARVVLGQRSIGVTEIYAEMDDEKARKAIRRIG